MFKNLRLTGRFLISRQFLIHLVLAIVTVLLLITGIQWYLKSYTRFGEDNYISVPNLVGTQSDELDLRLSHLGLRYVIVDSVFSDKHPKGTVLLQSPGPTDSTGQFAKEGRMIYLTVVSRSPKMINMPNLVYKSKKHAEGILRIVGLKARYTYKPYADCKDCVIEQRYNNRPIATGERIEKGHTVELVLGMGRNAGLEMVPVLTGKTIEEANSSLNTVSLSLYVASCEGCVSQRDSLNARIYRQWPASGGEATAGSEVSVWLTTDVSRYSSDDE